MCQDFKYTLGFIDIAMIKILFYIFNSEKKKILKIKQVILLKKNPFIKMVFGKFHLTAIRNNRKLKICL